MCQEAARGTVSYNDLAARISSETDGDASRQAFFYRTKEEAIEFFKQILAAVIKQKHRLPNAEIIDLKFKRILIQDSTIIRLPDKFYEIFSGVRNALSTVCNARIQGVYDLLSGNFVSFSIDSYSKNDLIAAQEFDVQEGDLMLRDRGYFVLDAIDAMKHNGADSIMRYKHKTLFFDPTSLKELDLLSLLRTNGSLDIIAVTGKEKNIKVRILAAAVPEEVANIRRMRAKKEAKKKRACSYELLQLLGWTIFITTIEDTSFGIQDACNIYSLRWRIECIFKTWKSNFSFEKFHNVSELQLRILLHARLILITAAYQFLYNPIEQLVYKSSGKRLSLLKFMRFISRCLATFVNQFVKAETRDQAVRKAAQYCCYEKRNRKSFADRMEFIKLT
jgi:hypothetical protein